MIYEENRKEKGFQQKIHLGDSFLSRGPIIRLSQLYFNLLFAMREDPTLDICGVKRVRGKRSSYARISLKTRLVFFRKVVEEGADLRQIARRLKINFSTAKTLVRNYRPSPEPNAGLVDTLCAEFDGRSRPRKRCSYRMVEDLTVSSQEGRSEESGSEGGVRWGGRIEIISHSLCEQ